MQILNIFIVINITIEREQPSLNQQLHHVNLKLSF